MSRKGKHKPKRKPPTPKTEQTQSKAQLKPLWRRVLKFLISPLGLLVDALGIAASVFAVWEAYWGTLPEIHALGPDFSSPFALPFAVKNPSHIFDMRDVQWFCGIEKIEFSQNNGLQSFSLTEPPIAKIPAGETANFRCPIGVGSQDMKSGSLSLFVKFKTFYIPRISTTQPMTWIANANPPRWVEGNYGKTH